jgi:hypothetical protein
MRKTICLTIAALLCTSVANAALTGVFKSLGSESIANAVFTGDVDLYEFAVTNTGDNATSVEASFSGAFITAANTAFEDTSGIPQVFGFDVPDAFFVLPNSANVLATGTMDNATTLSSSFTLPGDTAILPGGGAETVMAFLAVTAGSDAPTFNTGRAAINGAFEDIVLGGGGGGDPVAEGMPAPGSEISLQGAFNDYSGILAEAIMLTNTNTGSDTPLEITGLAFDSNDGGLFGAEINSSDPLKIDLTIDVAAAQKSTEDAVSAVLRVQHNGGDDFLYTLTASVPEPSTIALSSLALVGLVGFLRRK